MKTILSRLYRKAFPYRPQDPIHQQENEYAEWWRKDYNKRRNLGIGEDDLAMKAKKSKLRAKVRGFKPYSPGKKSRLPTEKDPKSVSEFWTARGAMPEPNLQDTREVDARDIAYEAYNNNVINAEDAMNYKKWLTPIMPNNSEEYGAWQVVVDALLNREITKEELLDWRELMDMPPMAELPPKKVFEDDEEIFDWRTDEFVSKDEWNNRYPDQKVAILSPGFIKLAKQYIRAS